MSRASEVRDELVALEKSALAGSNDDRLRYIQSLDRVVNERPQDAFQYAQHVLDTWNTVHDSTAIGLVLQALYCGKPAFQFSLSDLQRMLEWLSPDLGPISGKILYGVCLLLLRAEANQRHTPKNARRYFSSFVLLGETVIVRLAKILPHCRGSEIHYEAVLRVMYQSCEQFRNLYKDVFAEKDFVVKTLCSEYDTCIQFVGMKLSDWVICTLHRFALCVEPERSSFAPKHFKYALGIKPILSDRHRMDLSAVVAYISKKKISEQGHAVRLDAGPAQARSKSERSVDQTVLRAEGVGEGLVPSDASEGVAQAGKRAKV